MASNIVSSTIDATYPVAGVDNDTQGFRDNFQIIKDGLAQASSEITTLQDTTVKLTDTDQGVVENDFNESSILDASLDNVTFKLKPNENWEAPVANVDIGRGHYQVYTLMPAIGSDVTVQFSLENWPIRNTNDGVARVSLHILGNGNNNIIKLVAANGGAIFTPSDWPATGNLAIDNATDDSAAFVVTSTTQPVIVDLWSYDSGTTVYANLLGQFAKSSDA